MKKVPAAKQDPDYQHPAIELWLLKRKKGASLANLLQLEAREAADLVAAMEALTMLATGTGGDAASSSREEETVDGAAAGGGVPLSAPEAAAAAAAAAAGSKAGGQAADAAILQAAEAVGAAGDRGSHSTAAAPLSSSGMAAADGRTGADGCPATPPVGVSGRNDDDVDMLDASPAAAADTGPSSRAAATAYHQQQQQPPCRTSSKASGPAGHAGDQGLVSSCSSGVGSSGGGSDTSQLSWATRRQGSMAARLLADVQVPK